MIVKIIRLKNSFREIYVYYIILHNSTIIYCFVLSISINTVRIHCARTFFFLNINNITPTINIKFDQYNILLTIVVF